jgi:hypothetical protein
MTFQVIGRMFLNLNLEIKYVIAFRFYCARKRSTRQS